MVRAHQLLLELDLFEDIRQLVRVDRLEVQEPLHQSSDRDRVCRCLGGPLPLDDLLDLVAQPLRADLVQYLDRSDARRLVVDLLAEDGLGELVQREHPLMRAKLHEWFADSVRSVL